MLHDAGLPSGGAHYDAGVFSNILPSKLEVKTNHDKICPNENVTFTTNAPPSATIRWKGGGNPSTGTGATFITRFDKEGVKTITAELQRDNGADAGVTGADAGGGPDTLSATAKVTIKECSGTQWVNRFAPSTETSALTPAFQQSVDRFIAALDAAGANHGIIVTYRPVERQYLQHYAWAIAHQENDGDPATIPTQTGVEICWLHRDSNGNPDLATSRAKASEMVAQYHLAGRPAWPISRHFQKRALDMTVSWGPDDITLLDATGNQVPINSSPRNEYNAHLHGVAASYGVVWANLPNEHHWSDDGG